ncbi:MAG: hypothetical protein FJ279_35375, partial [Planctomycetes bacterium]|nr:hypothetical protein [Planctomycetota bacterium]
MRDGSCLMRRNASIVLLLLVASAGITLAANDDNRLSNAGFEVLEGALPRGWTPPGKAAPPALDRQRPHSGHAALRFDGDGQSRGLRQTLAGFAARPFTVAGWVRAENVVIAQGDSASLYVHVIYKDKPYAAATHAYHRIESGTYDWRRVEIRVDPVASYEIKGVLVTCNAKFGAGTLWFDDLELLESTIWSDLAHAREHVQWLRDSLADAAKRGADVAAAAKRADEAAALLHALEADVKAIPIAEAEQRLERARHLADGVLPLLSKEAAATFWSVASDSPTREIRALYHGGAPTQAQVAANLDRVQALRANTLYPSLGSWRRLAYPSDLADTYPEWQGRDTLKFLLAEARRRHITVIPYFGVFNAVPPDAEMLKRTPPGFLAQRHPADPQKHLAFPAPSHPEAREHVVKIAVELFQRYDLDGLGLDYIRYLSPQALCVCGRCRADVQARYGFDVREGDPWADEAKSRALQAWRAEHVTETVRAIVAAVRAVKPNALL